MRSTSAVFLQVSFACLCGTASAQLPLIYYRGVLNSASYMSPGLPGGGIARGSVFSIFGSNIGPASSPSLAFPLQTTLGNVSVTVSSGSNVVHAIPIYVGSSQINAITVSYTHLTLPTNREV